MRCVLFSCRNNCIYFYSVGKDLMPIHCCAAQGRTDAIMLLLDRDNQGKIRRALDRETEVNLCSECFMCIVWYCSIVMIDIVGYV